MVVNVNYFDRFPIMENKNCSIFFINSKTKKNAGAWVQATLLQDLSTERRSLRSEAVY